jgi:lysophospholipase L1-like esterase
MNSNARKARLTRVRLWLAKITVLGLSILFGGLAIEAFLRVSGRDRPLLWEPDPQLGWHHIPGASLHWVEEGDGHVQINALGFRDTERALEKDHGVFRIAVFGDSTTEAVQVDLEQTFTRLLEKRLQRCGRRVEVLNFGVSGYGPLQEYLLYLSRGKQFAPDLVLEGVFLDNDVADGDRRLATGQRGAPFLEPASKGEFAIDDSAAVASSLSYTREPVHTLRRYSAIYRMLRAGRSASLSELASGLGATGSAEPPKRFLLYSDPLSREWEEAWEAFERVITRFAATVRQDGATFALVSVPAGQVVHPQVWRQLLQQHPAMSARQWDVLSAEKRLRLLAERHNIPLIAPLDVFIDNISTGPLFFKEIGHLTPRGHEVMADALDAALAEQGLVRGSDCGSS